MRWKKGGATVDKYIINRLLAGTGITVLVAIFGGVGMTLTGIYCFVPLTALALCLALPLLVFSFMGLLLCEED